MNLSMKFLGAFFLLTLSGAFVSADITLKNETKYNLEVLSSGNVITIKSGKSGDISLDRSDISFSIRLSHKGVAFGQTTFVDQSLIKNGALCEVHIRGNDEKILKTDVNDEAEVLLWHVDVKCINSNTEKWIRAFYCNGFINAKDLQEQFYDLDSLELQKNAPQVDRVLLPDFDAVAHDDSDDE